MRTAMSLGTMRDLLDLRSDALTAIKTGHPDVERHERRVRHIEQKMRQDGMYIHNKVTKNVTQSVTARTPFDFNLPKTVTDKASRMEVWATTAARPGNDFCLFCVFDDNDTQISCIYVKGF